MFKKTPIALAILMLAASMSYAQSQSDDIQVNQAVGKYYRYDNGTSDFMEMGNANKEYKKNQNTTTLVNLQSLVVEDSSNSERNHNSTILYSNFSVFKHEVKDQTDAVIGGPGTLGFGLSIVDGHNISNLYDIEDQQIRELKPGYPENGGNYNDDNSIVVGHQNPRVLVKAFDQLTLKTNGDSAIRTQVKSGQDDGDIFIAAKNTVIETTSTDPDAYAIRLEGSDSDDNIYEGDEKPSLVFLKADSDRLVELNREYRYFWNDPANEDYGQAADQTLTITATQNAVLLDRRSEIDVHAGTVNINGRVYLDHGSSFMMGYNVAPIDKIPEYLVGYIGTKESTNTYRINSVNIQACEDTSKSFKDQDPAVTIKNGSHFTVSANTVTISGVKKNENQYSTAILLDTTASKYMADDGPYFLPSILSLHAKDNLVINGDIILDHEPKEGTNSTALVDIRSDGDLTVNGKISVINTEGQSGNTVRMTIKGHGQAFTGEIVDKINELFKPKVRMMRMSPMMLMSQTEEETSVEVKPMPGTFVEVSDGGQMTFTGDSSITELTADDATISAVGDSTIDIDHLILKSKGMTLAADGVQSGQFKVQKNTSDDDAKVKLVINNADGVQSADALKSVYQVTDGNQAFDLFVNESDGSTNHKLSVDKNGNVTSFEVEDNTSVSKAINDVAGLGIMAWRAQMNDVNKRLGDLRTYQGQYGGWARVYGSETKYGDLGLKSESNTVQVGADMKIAENFYFGATASYTDGKGKLNNGSTDDRAYSFGVYGGWIGDDGQFVDVIIKEHNFKTDFDLRYTTSERSTGDFDLWGTSICAEYGWRLNVADGFWVEPQAEMTYGYMNDVTYEYTGGVKATQEATESLVGRLGVAFGTTFDRGSAYVKASVAHDWMGETEISMSNGNAPMKEDLGGTWGEFAIGGTYNFANGWAVYGEFQTAKGSKMKTPYQYNIGARYIF